ncbi:MAG TPA: ferredoxin, partial [Myxococcota bacterium]|nr:ferredoxin [Myxococcota bacterium]
MPRYLTLSRAARLVGVRRGALQAKIRTGELAAFEGMVSEEDLLRAYPEAHLEDNAVLERLEAIKEAAFARRVRERVLPSAEVLMARLAELEHYRTVVQELQARLRAPSGAAGLLEWLQERLAPTTPGGRP